jgi:hypothetical protein
MSRPRRGTRVSGAAVGRARACGVANALRRVTVVAVLVAAAGCDDRAALRRRASAPLSQRMVGVWDARFGLERPVTAHRVPSGTEVRGTITLAPNESMSGGTSVLSAPTHYGTWGGDFTPFGFDPRPRGHVPTVAAQVGGTDSVTIVLEPESDVYPVVLQGVLRGDSVAGAWEVEGRALTGGGRFVLTRHKS